MTLTTTEELKHLASSDNTNELTRRLARECLANRQAQPVALVDRRPAASGSICWQNGGKDLPHGTELFTDPPAPAYAQPAGYFVRHRSTWNNPSTWSLWTECRGEDYAEYCKRIATGEADAGRFYEARILYDAPPELAAPQSTHASDWGINMQTGTPILVYKNCSVIESEQAHYVLSLINGAATPAPAVPGIDELRQTFERAERESDDGFNLHKYGIGYKLVPIEPTEDMIAAAMNCDDVTFNADETFCVNFGNIYAAMVAAAPEGGNDHDTRR